MHSCRSSTFGNWYHVIVIKRKLCFLVGLSFYTSEKTLRAAFEPFGELVEGKFIFYNRKNSLHTFRSFLDLAYIELTIFIISSIVKIIMDKISKRSKGYAFVEYSNEDAATKALHEMNGKVSLHNI